MNSLIGKGRLRLVKSAPPNQEPGHTDQIWGGPERSTGSDATALNGLAEIGGVSAGKLGPCLPCGIRGVRVAATELGQTLANHAI